MQRTPSSPAKQPANASSEAFSARPLYASKKSEDQAGSFWDMLGCASSSARFALQPAFIFVPSVFRKTLGAVIGFLFALGVILFELRLRRASLRRLIGAATGSILGIFGAYLTSLILTHTIDAGEHAFVLQPRRFPRDGLHRPGARREQRRHAESAGLRRRFRQRTQHASTRSRCSTPA